MTHFVVKIYRELYEGGHFCKCSAGKRKMLILPYWHFCPYQQWFNHTHTNKYRIPGWPCYNLWHHDREKALWQQLEQPQVTSFASVAYYILSAIICNISKREKITTFEDWMQNKPCFEHYIWKVFYKVQLDERHENMTLQYHIKNICSNQWWVEFFKSNSNANAYGEIFQLGNVGTCLCWLFCQIPISLSREKPFIN